MKLRPLPIKGKLFMFLDLPAELRNKIYEIICSGQPVKLSRRAHEVVRRRKSDQAHSYLQLAHINRQIRQEFLPVYYHNIVPHFDFNDTPEFVRNFLLPRTINSGVHIVTLDISRITQHNQRPINVYPLLKFCKADPSIELGFVRSPHVEKPPFRSSLRLSYQVDISVPDFRTQALLRDLTSHRKTLAHKMWAQYFDRCVKELWITPSNRPHVRVVVKTGATEWWMGCDQIEERDLLAWIAKTGFPYYSRPSLLKTRLGCWTVEVRGL
ncbi:hypothetical protein EKO04_004200 [Ascochyta lentis]|uniref:2EXR domain-containing protein n=1 Tax=Ascochyta lentis TaxID=205686 RepID=A0A8H7J804_9PLEO|nr:hypothetical protein EKO04_004200 [Ascochyta lentis]